jgi:hypothetical protein
MNREEEMALRELAAGRCAIQKVIDVLGPMSLWSKTELEKEISNAVAAEREECAQLCDRFANRMMSAEECAAAIRARGNT